MHVLRVFLTVLLTLLFIGVCLNDLLLLGGGLADEDIAVVVAWLITMPFEILSYILALMGMWPQMRPTAWNK